MVASRKQLDLRDKRAVTTWFSKHKPDAVIMAAAKVGGIAANNSMPVSFLLENLEIQNAVINAAFEHNVTKLVFLGSNCIYPINAPIPTPETSLLCGPPEPTNEWYAIAKIAGIKLWQAFYKEHGANFISVMPTSVFGPNDNFNLQNGHVIAALIARLNEAKLKKSKTLSIWGSGEPRREFLYVDDLADAIVFLLKKYSQPEIVNIGSGEEISIQNLALRLRSLIDWDGDLVFDKTKPDGAMRKAVCSKKIRKLGWRPTTDLSTGLQKTIAWYDANPEKVRK